MPFISSSELCSRIKALYRKTLYLNNPFLKSFAKSNEARCMEKCKRVKKGIQYKIYFIKINSPNFFLYNSMVDSDFVWQIENREEIVDSEIYELDLQPFYSQFY